MRKFKNSKEGRHLQGLKKTWCMDLAYGDQLVRDNKGVKYLLVRQDFFYRTVRQKGKKSEDSIETVRAFFNTITAKNWTRKILDRQRKRICWRV